tara:strand:- start:83 stop:448 length:366 start_codon:yes stop_codon:yes gene_type:complete
MEGDDTNRILVPVVTGNIVLRGLPYSVKDRLMVVRRRMEWNSWADMAYWVLANSERIGNSDSTADIDWSDTDTGFIVCRDIPLEVRDQLARLKRIHGWQKWTDMITFVLDELEVDEIGIQD